MIKVWVVFFHHFLAMAMVTTIARVAMMFVASPFFLGNVLVAMFTYASSTCFELASDTKGFFRGHNVVMEEDSKLWQWKIMAEELKDKD